MHLKSILLIILMLSTFVAKAKGIDTELIKINQIRAEHFERGNQLDTLHLEKFVESESEIVKKFALFIKAIYDLENSRNAADKKITDLIDEKKWLNDIGLKNFGLLAIDDLFRICMSSKRYLLFHQINIILNHDKPFSLMSYAYDSYLFLKSGNLYNFFERQNIFKNLFIIKIDSFKSEYSKDVLNRLKCNLISIGLSNYDSTNQIKFFNKLKEIANEDVNNNSPIEDVLFLNELANWQIIKNFDKYNKILVNKLNLEFSPSFIIRVTYNNFSWKQNSNNYFIDLLNKNKYPLQIYLNSCLDFYWHDYESIKINFEDRFWSWGQYDFSSAIMEEKKDSIINFKYLDSLLNHNYFFEPNWNYLQLSSVIKRRTISRELSDVINNIKKLRYNQNAFDGQINAINLYNQYHKLDMTELIDFSNIFFGPTILLDEYNKIKNELTFDTTYTKRYDSIIGLINFLKETNYFKGYFSNEKSYLLNGLMNICTVLKNIFLSRKLYNQYDLVSEFFDFPLTDSIPNSLKVIKDKYRFLNFSRNASLQNKFIFDSLFISQLNFYQTQHIKNDSLRNEQDFYSDIAKNISIEIHSRGSINDSTLIHHLSYQQLQNELIDRFSEDNTVYNQGIDSLQAIISYKNNYFCIDDSKLKIPRYNDTLYYSFINELNNFIAGRSVIDSNSHIIAYIIAEDYYHKGINQSSSLDSIKEYLYIAYSDSRNAFFKKLISLDSLYSIIDLNNPKSSNFFSPTYFQVIDNNSKNLYNILLKPIEGFIDSTNKYKLLLPNILMTLPLDYVFSKEKGFLPRFNDYSGMTAITFEDKNIKRHFLDTITVFSEMMYNDVYCNINKANNPYLRGGISELKYSNIEMQGIKESMKVKTYRGTEATKTNFLNSLLNKTTTNLHLITHGSYIPIPDFNTQKNNIYNNENISYSSIPGKSTERQLLLFSSDSTNHLNKNNLLLSEEIKYLDDLSHINLVFLSACETGLIDDNRSNKIGFSGFAKEFIDRGVKSVIATRWKIQDKAASEFAKDYYKNLAKYNDYGEAFYITKKNYFKENKAPATWTSYVFIK